MLASKAKGAPAQSSEVANPAISEKAAASPADRKTKFLMRGDANGKRLRSMPAELHRGEVTPRRRDLLRPELRVRPRHYSTVSRDDVVERWNVQADDRVAAASSAYWKAHQRRPPPIGDRDLGEREGEVPEGEEDPSGDIRR